MSLFKRIRALWWLSGQLGDIPQASLKEVINKVLHRNKAIIVEMDDILSKIDL